MSDGEITIPNTIPHPVVGNWPEGSRLFFFNPTSGAVEVRPERRSEVERSLNRVARKMYRAFFFLKLRLQIEYFALKVRYAALVLLRNGLRYSRFAS